MTQSAGPQAGPMLVVSRTVVLRRWRDEWDRWSAGGEAAAGLARWSADPALAGYTTSLSRLLAAAGRDDPASSGEADAVLAALVRHARGGDLAAARVVLERLVPALGVRAVRHGRSGRVGFGGVFAELVGSAWLCIRCNPLECGAEIAAAVGVSDRSVAARQSAAVRALRGALVQGTGATAAVAS